uniref:Concanavalin-like n=1 Tax=Rousettus bat poxvirus TaxID=3141933 RepID=A0AAU7E273_9POXV
MYRAVCNVAKPACAIADSLLGDTDSDVDMSDECARALTAMINHCLGEDAVHEITDTCLVHLRYGDTSKPYFLTSAVDDDDDTFTVQNSAVLERTAAFFVVCLSGDLEVNFASERGELRARISIGEAFLLDADATHSLTSQCAEVKLLVVRMLTTTLMVHRPNCVVSGSPAVYERCAGTCFARYRVVKGNLIVRDLVLVNRLIFDTWTLEVEPAVHLNQVLAPLKLVNAPLLAQVPDAYASKACVMDICACDSEEVFEHIPRRLVVGAVEDAYVAYSVQTLYGVWQ